MFSLDIALTYPTKINPRLPLLLPTRDIQTWTWIHCASELLLRQCPFFLQLLQGFQLLWGDLPHVPRVQSHNMSQSRNNVEVHINTLYDDIWCYVSLLVSVFFRRQLGKKQIVMENLRQLSGHPRTAGATPLQFELVPRSSHLRKSSSRAGLEDAWRLGHSNSRTANWKLSYWNRGFLKALAIQGPCQAPGHKGVSHLGHCLDGTQELSSRRHASIHSKKTRNV